MWLLTILILSSVSGAKTLGGPTALNCIQDFVKKYDLSTYYSANLKKTEFDFGGTPLTENLKITEYNKKKIVISFMDKGLTGIKNNGMTVTYQSGETVDIQLGKPRGIGFLAHGAATFIKGRTLNLFSTDMLRNQVFTVNRAGFGYLARVLKKRLPDLQTGKLGTLSLNGSKCTIHFQHDPKQVTTLELSPEDSIRSIEERYGTLAYFIFKDNKNSLKRFFNLFHRDHSLRLKIHHSFTDFDLVLNDEKLPSLVELFWDGRPVGRYEFSDIEMH
jgi:hypothetical protein